MRGRQGICIIHNKPSPPSSPPPDTTASQLAKMLTAGSAPVVAADALENVSSQQMSEWESPESPRYDTITVFKVEMEYYGGIFICMVLR